MFKNMKRVLSLVMVIAMLATYAVMFASCVTPGEGDGTTAGAGTDPNAPVAGADYTYNSYLTTFPTVWNVHTYQTATDATIIDYTEEGFYTFDYNEAKDGYKMVCAIAAKFPEDVTAQYVGKYGLEEGAKNRAWKITLRSDLKWQDGTAITAEDFIQSAERLLNPIATNYRADNFYSGDLVLNNAKNYAYSEKTVQVANSGDGETMTVAFADLVKGADGVYTTADGKIAYFGFKTALAWCSGRTMEYYKSYFGEELWGKIEALFETVNGEDGMVKVTDNSIELLYTFTGSAVWGNESKADLGYYVFFPNTYAKTEFDQVGIEKISDTEFVLVLDKELSGFYLHYALGSSWLVNIPLYDSCKSVTDGVYNTTYGTSVETYMAYGPYKLTSFQMDRQIVLEKNDQWYGYALPENKNLYWTTKIVYDKVEDSAQAFELFLQGKLDSYGLTKEEMDEYAKSEHTYYQPGQSTYFIAMNPDFEALKNSQGEGKNKTIITIKEFRQAISFALNRAEFCLATSPTNGPAYALFSELIVSDPDNGIKYRNTDEAKQVLVDFWGLTDYVGEGKLYPTVDEAIASITGYNLEMAKQYFNKAYDQAIADGLMKETDVVEICVGLPSKSSFYTNGYEFLVNNYTEAVKGTKLEGKLTFTSDDTIGNAFSDALKSNQVNLLFGVGWTGSALNPYSLMEAYTSKDYQYDPAWDTTTAQLSITIDGKAYKASVWDWTTTITGTEITVKAEDGTEKKISAGSADNNPELRLQILAAIEGAVLQSYDMIPIMDASSATIKGMQIKYYTEEYIFGMGRGGIKYYTYNYTDAEWDAFVASNNGLLNYK